MLTNVKRALLLIQHVGVSFCLTLFQLYIHLKRYLFNMCMDGHYEQAAKKQKNIPNSMVIECAI